jgi:hypothetical protein
MSKKEFIVSLSTYKLPLSFLKKIKFKYKAYNIKAASPEEALGLILKKKLKHENLMFSHLVCWTKGKGSKA